MKKQLISVLGDMFCEATVTGEDIIPEVIQPGFGIFDPANVLSIIPMNQKSYDLLRFYNNHKDDWKKVSDDDMKKRFDVENQNVVASYSLEYLTKIIAFCNFLGSQVRIRMSNNYPMRIEIREEDKTDGYHFVFYLAPRIEAK